MSLVNGSCFFHKITLNVVIQSTRSCGCKLKSRTFARCHMNFQRMSYSSLYHSVNRKFAKTTSVLGDPMKHKEVQKYPFEDHDKYKLIYKLPQMRLVYALSRVKIYQTFFFIAATPFIYSTCLAGNVSLLFANLFAAISFVATCSLFGFSFYTKRMIGYLWVDSDLTNIKIAYLTFWARRKDICIPIASVETLDDFTENYLKPLVKLGMNDSKDFYFISLRFGNITNLKLFQQVFGFAAAESYKGYKSRN